MADEEKNDDDGDVKTSASTNYKRKLVSRTEITSKSSIKSGDSSVTSSGSLTMKRQSEIERYAKTPRYQNTYRLDSKKPFKSNEVYGIIKNIVEKEVSILTTYDGLMGPRVVQTIAADVRQAVKSLNFERYKICVIVYLGEKKLQGFQAAFRALWDQDRDGWTTYYYENRTYFVACACFGLYHD